MHDRPSPPEPRPTPAAPDDAPPQEGEPVAGVPGDNTTLTSVIDELESQGYESQFEVVEGGSVRCCACGETVSAEAWAMRADGIRRLEGASDPDDLLSVVAARCPNCAAAGTAVLGYGPAADEDEAVVAAELAVAAQRASGPEPIEHPPRDSPPGDSPLGDSPDIVSVDSETSGSRDGLVAVVFDDPLHAQEFLLATRRLAANGSLVLRDAVLVAKDADGSTQVRESVDPQPGRSAMSGALWAGLLGLLFGGPVGWVAGLGIGAGVGATVAKVVDIGVPDEWVAWFREAVTPGSTSLVLLVEGLDAELFRDEVARFPGAALLHTTIDARALAEIDAAP